MFCAFCGRDIGDTDMFCVYCGNPTAYYRQTHTATATAEQRAKGEYNYHEQPKQKTEQPKQQSEQPEPEEIPLYDANIIQEQLVAVKPEYYMPKFMDMMYSNRKVRWNWCAFFVPAYWYIYRKMYGQAATYFVLFWLFTAMGGAGIFVQIMSGLFGNYIYFSHIKKLAGQAAYMSEKDRESFIARKGGTNKWGVIALVLIVAVLVLLFVSFVMAIYYYTS